MAFDQSHLNKNIRSQFLSRSMIFIGVLITSDYLKQLYNKQKGMIVKAVRCLTRKVLFPTSFEKMNVLRAIQVFSQPVTAALKTMLLLNQVKLEDRESLEKKIFFMESIRKWFEIHDVWQSHKKPK